MNDLQRFRRQRFPYPSHPLARVIANRARLLSLVGQAVLLHGVQLAALTPAPRCKHKLAVARPTARL
eukprot:6777164-Alexandrium_andersonii.AAC.1